MHEPKEYPELFAWLGEDEMGSGQIGLKQADVPAGRIPIVAVDRHRTKIEKYWPQAEAQARAFGKRIALVRYIPVEVVMETASGS